MIEENIVYATKDVSFKYNESYDEWVACMEDHYGVGPTPERALLELSFFLVKLSEIGVPKGEMR